MLQSLSVENYALIEKTEINWRKGFSVITGETGSGKSILLGALGLIQGARADIKTLKDTEKKCVVEAEFDVAPYALQPFFSANELDYDDICLIRREITPNGKSRAFVNDTPVSLNVLRELTAFLIDIHSQHETLLLNESSFQMHVLDALSDTKSLLNEYAALYRQYQSSQKRLNEMIANLEQQNANRDYLEFQLNQLNEADFSPNEQSELEEESDYLSHTTELKDALSKVKWLLSEKDENVCSALKEMNDAITSVLSVYTDLEPVGERLNSAWIELKDLSREVEQRLADVTVDPQRLEFITQRLDLIYTLEKKHKVNDLPSLLEVKQSFEDQLNGLDSSSDQIDALKKEIKVLESQLSGLAQQISQKRKSAKQPMEQSVCDILRDLGIANANFEVKLETLPSFNEMGTDAVSFLFSANKNAPLQPLSSVASGGEMSRLMLALKSILSKTDNLPTIILDEIDTGVSGEVADRMGRLMKSMGEYMQVVSITHLPQIASKGATHYKVYKEDNEVSTVSHIKELTKEERVMEIAQMLSGSNPSETAQKNARELLSY
ncbi:MAG: DNA repair protein RecN [Paludibacteraceae bacterium]|nr:DNA repair protein RecN [Paludibacteraceae bacterium]